MKFKNGFTLLENDKDVRIWVKGKANYWVNKKYTEFVRNVT